MPGTFGAHNPSHNSGSLIENQKHYSLAILDSVFNWEPVGLKPHGSISALSLQEQSSEECTANRLISAFVALNQEKIIRNRLEVFKSDRLLVAASTEQSIEVSIKLAGNCIEVPCKNE